MDMKFCIIFGKTISWNKKE